MSFSFEHDDLSGGNFSADLMPYVPVDPSTTTFYKPFDTSFTTTKYNRAALSSCCNGSESYFCATDSVISYDGDIGLSLVSGKSVTSSCTSDYFPSRTESFGSCNSDTRLSDSNFDKIFASPSPLEESFSDFILYDDVFDLPEVINSDQMTTQSQTYMSGNQNCGALATKILQSDGQEVINKTFRNTHNIISCSTKPRRKRTQTSRQRSAANVRERNRMVYLNQAFNVLRNKLPGLNNKKLSRIETLRSAISYIKCMKSISS